MTFELCESRGFDADAIARRLCLVGLAQPESGLQAKALQDQVIAPNLESIVDDFYDSLLGIDNFSAIVSAHSSAERLKKTQIRYISSLGVNFDQHQYFEDRLRIGSIHQKIGIPQSLYLCSFQLLQSLLIRYIPENMRSNDAALENMLQFILKITALDMSLTVESYCAANISGFKKSLDSERGEKARLHKLAVTDWLTQLHNHSYSRNFLSNSLRQAKTDGLPLSIIMADLDNFKKINDRNGHLVGDQVLRIVAERMVSASREGDEICRYGGEEFLIILKNTDIAAGADVAERVRKHLRSDAIHVRNTEVNVSLSLGIAQAREGDDVDTLIERADSALYVAKLAGRNRIRLEA